MPPSWSRPTAETFISDLSTVDDVAAGQGLGTAYGEEAVTRILDRVVEVGGEVTFPVAPLPVLVPTHLVDRMLDAVRSYFEFIKRPGFLPRARRAVADGCGAVGSPEPIPVFSQFDFALSASAGGGIDIHLVECQGVSSLMGFVPFYGHLLAEELAPGHTPLLSHRDLEHYAADLRRVMSGAWLVDVDVHHQRLRADFWILRHLAGVEVKDLTRETVTAADRQGPALYNRILPPEARRAGVFEVMRELYGRQRRWITHPDWYYALSKGTLMDLQRVSSLVPECTLLTPDTARTWGGRRDVVLKPVDDYGGSGVILEPGEEDYRRALADPQPHMLQRRIDIDRLLTAPDGQRLFCELRVLCLEETPCALFVRVADDPLVSIARNTGYSWCGITAGLVRRNP